MIAFVKGIFYDLSGRIQKMLADLSSRQQTSDVPHSFFQKTITLLHDLSWDVNTILASPELAFEPFTNNFLSKYSNLYERFSAIELYRYQAIIRYGQGGEKYFNALIKQIYEEIDCIQSTPLIAGISNSDSYYWVYPTYEIIAVPIGEDKNLLNLPDIFHEIGHLLCGQYRRSFKGEGKIDKMLGEHFETEINNIRDENRDLGKIPEFKKVFEYWRESWIEEFICDLVGTYLTGPAYGWTNFKICTLTSSDKGIYHFSAEHPSDETRMYAILFMLEQMGYQHEKEELANSWSTFLTICTNTQMPLYSLLLPRHMIEELAVTVLDACQKICLVSCMQQAANSDSPISLLLNQAWDENLKRPDTFSEWEQNQIGGLQDTLLNQQGALLTTSPG